MQNGLDLMPYPREIKLSGGSFAWPREASVFLRNVSESDSARLRTAAGRLALLRAAADAAQATLALEIVRNLDFPASARTDVLDQGYTLDISASGIRARARSAIGLFYALQTLAQLGRGGAHPIGSIRDWPDLPFRALHTTGEGHIPRFDELLKMVEAMSALKYTALIIEYDDRFSFERYPVLNNPAAFTKDQIRELIAFAAERYFEIVPFLDSLGHAQCYLKHPEFQHLAELPGNEWELCPSNPETLRFIKNLWTEILEVHQGARLAGITGDEVFRLGAFCPACGKFARAGKLSGLYTNYYADLGRWVLERGARPMMWDDMILMHPEGIGRLPKETVFINWVYSGHDAAAGRRLFVRGAGEFRPGEENQVPERYARVFGKYFRATDGRTPFEPFPFLSFYRDHGFDALAAPMSNGAGFFGRIANNRLFCIAARKAGSMGLLNTTWELYLPIQNAWHGMAAGAAYAWNADDVAECALMERFARMTLGADNKLSRAAAVMERLLVEARGFDVAPHSGDHETLRDVARALRAQAGSAPDKFGKVYSELTALRMEMARRAAALQELAVLAFKLEHGAGDDYPVDMATGLNWSGSMPHRSGFFEPTPGRHVVHGIPFEIADPAAHGGLRGICVGGKKSPAGEEHGAAAHLPIGRACDALFFLAAGAWGRLGTVDGVFRMRFADGTHDDLPLIVGRNILDWSGGARSGRWLLDARLVAWEGGKAMDGGSGYRISMYLAWWKNPLPGEPIKCVEMLPQEENSGFAMLFGLTARAGGTTHSAPDARETAKLMANLLADMEKMEMEKEQLIERHRELYARLLAPADVDLRMSKLMLPDMQKGIAFGRKALEERESR